MPLDHFGLLSNIQLLSSLWAPLYKTKIIKIFHKYLLLTLSCKLQKLWNYNQNLPNHKPTAKHSHGYKYQEQYHRPCFRKPYFPYKPSSSPKS